MRRITEKEMNHEQVNQKYVPGSNGDGCSMRGNSFRTATTDADQPATCLQRRVQHHSALQRCLHLRNPYRNHRRVRQGPGAAQTTQKIVWKRMPPAIPQPCA
jgi:hypothetical protein